MTIFLPETRSFLIRFVCALTLKRRIKDKKNRNGFRSGSFPKHDVIFLRVHAENWKRSCDFLARSRSYGRVIESMEKIVAVVVALLASLVLIY